MAGTEVCPYCKSDKVAQILYGEPMFTDELSRALAEGKVVLGDCVPKPDNRACLNCQERWRAEQPARPTKGA